MREITFKQAEMRELSENAWNSREMRETWQVCVSHFNHGPQGHWTSKKFSSKIPKDF